MTVEKESGSNHSNTEGSLQISVPGVGTNTQGQERQICQDKSLAHKRIRELNWRDAHSYAAF